MATVLVVDDSALDRHLAATLLTRQTGSTGKETGTGIDVNFASTGKEALALIQQALPDLVLTDLQMPDMNGLELVKEVRNRYPSLPIILMTGQGSEDIAIQALQ